MKVTIYSEDFGRVMLDYCCRDLLYAQDDVRVLLPPEKEPLVTYYNKYDNLRFCPFCGEKTTITNQSGTPKPKDQLLYDLEEKLSLMVLSKGRDPSKIWIERRDELIRRIKDRKEELGIG